MAAIYFKYEVIKRALNGGVSGNTSNTRFQTIDDMVARVGAVVSILPPEYRRPK